MKKLLCLIAVLLCLSGSAWAQTTTTSTTLSAVVSSTSTQNIRVTSATGFVAGSTYAFVDSEAMDVLAVNGTSITVMRGTNGTVARLHNSGTAVYVGPSSAFVSYPTDPAGRCVSGNYAYLPLINVRTGSVISCTNSEFVAVQRQVGGLLGAYGNNLTLQTFSDNKPVTINSRGYTQATGSSIGFQVKPSQNVASTGSIIGGEISPRVASGITMGASVIGLHVDSYLKGTAVGTITGDVRGLQVEMITDDAGTRTIGGNVSGIRIRSAFSATAITGNFVPIRIEVPETMTNSQTYDAVLELTGTVPLVWNSAPGTEPSTADGYIKVLINGVARYIQLYSGAPVD
jgi:hypothetical protein